MRTGAKWVVCVVVLAAFAGLMPHYVQLPGGVISLLAAGTVLWLANLVVRPVLQIFSLPITLATLGIFYLIVNGAMVALADALIPGIHITHFWVCILAALAISVGNSLVTEHD